MQKSNKNNKGKERVEKVCIFFFKKKKKKKKELHSFSSLVIK